MSKKTDRMQTLAAFHQINKTLEAVYPAMFEMSTPGKKFYDAGNVAGQELVIMVHIDGTFLRVAIGFEARPGVWHDLGNFCDEPFYKAILEKFGISRSSARSDFNGLQAVVDHINQLVA